MQPHCKQLRQFLHCKNFSANLERLKHCVEYLARLRLLFGSCSFMPEGMASNPLFSSICCPTGAIAQNGICYCTDQQAKEHPFACRVICDALISNLPPARGGCQCKKGYGGALCDLEPCYIYSQESDRIKLFCKDDIDQYFDCSNATNLSPRTDFMSLYGPCPCLNDAQKTFQNGSDYLYSCVCSEPYSGDLCHIARGTESNTTELNDQVTANTFLAIIAFSLFVITVAFCCVRRYRHKKRKRTETATDCHRYYRSPPASPGIGSNYISLLSYGHVEQLFGGGDSGSGNAEGKNGDHAGMAAR